MTQPLGQTVSYAYDARGRLETVTNARDHVLHHRYLPWGGLESVVHDLDGDGPEAGEREIAYAYDESGNLTSVSDSEIGASPLYTFTYDELDRVDTVTAHYLPGGPVLDSSYDRFADRDALGLTDATGTVNHGWAFDAFGRLEAATLPGNASPLAFDYFANDALRQITHGNGLVTDLTYHPEGPLQSIKVGSTPLHELAYTVDAVLNVETITETIAGALQSPAYAYGYDGVSRLTSATYPTGLGLPASESFPYDAAGNRDDDPGSSTPWAYDANNRIMASPGTAVWCHDADGNLATKRTSGDCATGPVAESFTFDAMNRLRTWTDGTTTASYAYDPFGRRIQKTVGGTTTWYLWDGDRLLAEYDASGDRTSRYAFAGGWAPIQYARPDGASGEDVYDVHTDHLDTPKLLTDSSGSAVWRAAHEAFGKAALDPANTVSFHVRFPGQYFDAETGLHYNRFRYYEPTVGRYVSADPIGQLGGVNLYSYALNTPLNVGDIHGLDFTVIGTPGPARDRVEAGLEQFRSTPRGREIERAAGGLSIIVNDEGWNEFGRPGLPDDIFIDPSAPACVETEDGPQDTPVAARIAHEAGHAIGYGDDGPGRMTNVNRNENPVREALGFPGRTSYPSPPGDEGCTCSDARRR